MGTGKVGSTGVARVATVSYRSDEIRHAQSPRRMAIKTVARRTRRQENTGRKRSPDKTLNSQPSARIPAPTWETALSFAERAREITKRVWSWTWWA